MPELGDNDQGHPRTTRLNRTGTARARRPLPSCADCGHERSVHVGELGHCLGAACQCPYYACPNCQADTWQQLTIIDDGDCINCAVCGTTLRVIDG